MYLKESKVDDYSESSPNENENPDSQRDIISEYGEEFVN